MDKLILITGSSTGIGRACAEFLVKNGFKVYAGARKQADLDDLGKIPGIIPLKLDVTNQVDIDNAVKFIKSKKTGLFGLMNNAGIAVAGPLMEISDEDFERQFQVNLFGIHRITKAFFPFLLESKGRIIMMSSDSGFFATPFFGPYCSSKFALEGYSDSLRRELLLFGVKIILIQAGRITTPIWDKGEKILNDSNFNQKNSLFTKMARNIGEYAVKKGRTEGLEPIAIGKLVYKILTITKPKLRYLIAPNPLKYKIIKLLPGSRIDHKIKRELEEIK